MYNVRIYRSVMQIPGITLNDKIIVSKICQVAATSRWSTYTNAELAEMTTLSLSSVEKCIRRLAEMKILLIERFEQPGRSYRRIQPPYCLYNPDDPCDYYFDFTKEELKDPRFKLTEKFILKIISKLEKKQKKCFMGTYRFASELGVHYDTVKKALTKLKKEGFIRTDTEQMRRVLRVTPSYVTKPSTKPVKKANKKQNSHAVLPHRNTSVSSPIFRRSTPHILNDIGLSFIKKIISKDIISLSAIKYFKTDSGKLIDLSLIKNKHKTLEQKSNQSLISEQKSNLAAAHNDSKSPCVSKSIPARDAKSGLLPDSVVAGGIAPPSHKTKHKITSFDIALYVQLVNAGASNHRHDSKAYAKTLEVIHALTTPNVHNPYHNMRFQNSHVNKFVDHKFTHEEIMEIYTAHLEYSKINFKKPCKSFSSFVLINTPKGPMSIFLSTLAIMRRASKAATLTDSGKKLKDICDKNKIIFDLNGYNVLASKLKNATTNMHISTFATHLTYYSMEQLFVEYIKEKCENNLAFKMGYVFGDRFISEFTSDMQSARILIKEVDYATARKRERAMMGYY